MRLVGGVVVALMVSMVIGACGSEDGSGWPPPGGFEAGFDVVPSGLKVGAPVRIAGVDVGTVRAIRRADGVVRFVVGPAGLPVFRDAQVKIREHLFRQGLYFLDLAPGSNRSELLEEGARIPRSRTAFTPLPLYLRDPDLRRKLERFGRQLRRGERVPRP